MTTLLLLGLSCLCGATAIHLIEGPTAILYAIGGFYAPFGLRSALRGQPPEKGNATFWSVIIALLLLGLLTGCETANQRGARIRAEAEAAWAAKHSTRTISVHSVPSGAIVDWNGSYIGTTPFTYQLDKCYQGGWPANGHLTQTLRARWLDGMVQHELHPMQARPPEKVLFMHPQALAYARQPHPTALH